MLLKAPLADDVRRFLLTSVPSVPYLEALLLLRGSGSRSWTAADVAHRLYIREADAQPLLAALQESGIAHLLAEQEYAYAPSPTLAAVIDRLAISYAADLVGVTDLIHSRMDRRAQLFADAFRIKKTGA